ncbi:MAG: hypothetical protein Q9213_002581 [Squamulea squamosa]
MDQDQERPPHPASQPHRRHRQYKRTKQQQVAEDVHRHGEGIEKLNRYQRRYLFLHYPDQYPHLSNEFDGVKTKERQDTANRAAVDAPGASLQPGMEHINNTVRRPVLNEDNGPNSRRSSETKNVKKEQSVSPEPEVINVHGVGGTQGLQERMIPRVSAVPRMSTLPRSSFDMALTSDLRIHRGVKHSGSSYRPEHTRGINRPPQSLMRYPVGREPNNWDIVTSPSIPHILTGTADSSYPLNAPNRQQSLASHPVSYTPFEKIEDRGIEGPRLLSEGMAVRVSETTSPARRRMLLALREQQLAVRKEKLAIREEQAAIREEELKLGLDANDD